jgi:hypothetical protein
MNEYPGPFVPKPMALTEPHGFTAPLSEISVVHAKVAKLLKRGGPFSDAEKIAIAHLALRDIAKVAPRIELRDIALAALKVLG